MANLFIRATVAPYCKTKNPIKHGAKYHAGQYELIVELPTEDTITGEQDKEAYEALKPMFKKSNGIYVLGENNGNLVSFYSSFPFPIEDAFGEFAYSSAVPTLKEGTKVDLSLQAYTNNYGQFLSVKGVKLIEIAMPRFESAFEGRK